MVGGGMQGPIIMGTLGVELEVEVEEHMQWGGGRRAEWGHLGLQGHQS